MRSLKRSWIWLVVLAVLLALSAPAYAIGFVAEEVYESVFVIYSGNSLGSGFAVGSNCIVTNAHVIDNPRQIIVRDYGGSEYPAYLIGMDQQQDIAVLGVRGHEFPYLEVADPASMNTGDDIYAIGAPKSMAYTLTKGVISAKERRVGTETYIQIDAPINEGNSGGPLLNDSGQVLGMNTLKMNDSEGIGMAIPMTTVCAYLQKLGLKLDSTGNVESEVETPQEETTEPTVQLPTVEPWDEEQEEPADHSEKKETSNVALTACAVALVSIAGNIVQAVLLTNEKKKNKLLTAPPQPVDPRERTDFDIEFLE